MQAKALGQRHMGDGKSRQAISAVAALARKVHVQVVHGFVKRFAAMAVLHTERIFFLPASILDDMYQMVGKEMGQRAKDGGFVDRLQACFQIGQRAGYTGVLQFTQHKHPHGSRLDFPLQQ